MTRLHAHFRKLLEMIASGEVMLGAVLWLPEPAETATRGNFRAE